MRKENIAGYVGSILFILSFLTGAAFDASGHKHYGRVFVFIAMILLGLTMLIGIYSNIKNYGYIWTNVRREDQALSFAEMDKKYERKGKDTWQYRAAIASMCLVGLCACIWGAILLAKETVK